MGGGFILRNDVFYPHTMWTTKAEKKGGNISSMVKKPKTEKEEEKEGARVNQGPKTEEERSMMKGQRQRKKGP